MNFFPICCDVLSKDSKFGVISKSSGGGVILSGNKFGCKIIDTKYFDDNLWVVKCNFKNKPLYIIVIYIPPNLGAQTFDNFFESMDQLSLLF